MLPRADETLPNTRQRIVYEAAQLFAERGFHGVSMREVAQAVGVSKPALYHHYADKEALFMAVMEESLQDLALVLERSLQETGLRQQLLCLLLCLQRSAPRQRLGLRLAGELAHIGPQQRRDFEQRYRERWMNRLGALLIQAQQRGELRAELSIGALLSALLGLMYPLLGAHSAGSSAGGSVGSSAGSPEAEADDNLVRELLDIFLAGAAVSKYPKTPEP